MRLQERGAQIVEVLPRSQVRGEVRFDAGSRAMYATDASAAQNVTRLEVLTYDGTRMWGSTDNSHRKPRYERSVTAFAQVNRLTAEHMEMFELSWWTIPSNRIL